MQVPWNGIATRQIRFGFLKASPEQVERLFRPFIVEVECTIFSNVGWGYMTDPNTWHISVRGSKASLEAVAIQLDHAHCWARGERGATRWH